MKQIYKVSSKSDENKKDLLICFCFFLLTYIPYSLIFPYSLLNDLADDGMV